MKAKNRKARFITLLLFIFLFAPFQGATQSFLGFKGGGSFNFLGPGFAENYGDRVGYTLGITGHIQLAPKLYLNPEINYTRKAFLFYRPVFLDDRLIDTDVIVGLNYLDIPLNVGYGFFAQEEDAADMFIYMYGGFQFNRLLSQSNRFRARSEGATVNLDLDEFDDIRKTDFGINLGIGVGYNAFFFEGRYYFGFTSLFETEILDDFTNSVTLSVSYRFRLN